MEDVFCEKCGKKIVSKHYDFTTGYGVLIKEDGKEHKIIESATNKGKPLYRIFIGPYEGYSKAQEDLERVNEKFKVKGLIKKL